MSMYPNERTLTIDGQSVSYPGLVDGKFSDGSDTQQPSYIPAETINLILDNLVKLITDEGSTPNNVGIDQLSKVIRPGLMKFVGTDLNGDLLSVIKTAGRSGLWTFAAGTTSTPEGAATAKWYAIYFGNGVNGKLRAWKDGPSADDWVCSLVEGAWKPWMLSSTPPIGTEEFMASNSVDPATKWPGTSWSDVSWEEWGTVRRTGTDVDGNPWKSGIPAKFIISLAAGVPTVSVDAGNKGQNYLNGVSGSLVLQITGACTTQHKVTATVTSGAITALAVTQQGGGYGTNAGSGQPALVVYDGWFRTADAAKRHWHTLYVGMGQYAANGGGYGAWRLDSIDNGMTEISTFVAKTTISDGATGDDRSGAENKPPSTIVKKLRRIA